MGKRFVEVSEKGVSLSPDRVKELAGLVLCGVSFFCLISLAGLSFQKPICGVLGYRLANFLHLLFGQVSILTMTYLAGWGCLLVVGKAGDAILARVVGLFSFSLFFGLLLSLGLDPEKPLAAANSTMPYGAGGAICGFFGPKVFTIFGTVGSVLILLMAILISLLLATDFLFLDIVRRGFKRQPAPEKKEQEKSLLHVLVGGLVKGIAFLLSGAERLRAWVHRNQEGIPVAEGGQAGPVTEVKPSPATPKKAKQPKRDKPTGGTEKPPAEKPKPAKRTPIKIVAPAKKKPAPKKKVREGGVPRGKYRLPPENLLRVPCHLGEVDNQLVNKMAQQIEQKLASFKIEARVVSVSRGPAVTLFELRLAEGIRVNQITARDDDLAMALAAESLRVVAPIPGKGTVGVEVPNKDRETVVLRDLIPSLPQNSKKGLLPLYLAKDVMGREIISDLTKMPHLLVSGATGSGKSVCVNTMLVSLLMTRTPEEVGLILVDPKTVELKPYEGCPHLITPIVTDMTKVPGVLQWAVDEMEVRYRYLSAAGVRNIKDYNTLGEKKLREKMGEEFDSGQKPTPRLMKYVVIVIDEFADLMAVAAKDVETLIMRLAQKSRAVGLHVIMATQHPSREVVTGIIKANLPTRISFKVTQSIYSRVVLDQMGAEKLIGDGDMLFLPPGTSSLVRAQGAFVADDELEEVVKWWQDQAEPQYVNEILNSRSPAQKKMDGDDDRDESYPDAVRIVLGEKRGSATLLQRMMKIGYTRASRYIELMEEDGLVGPHVGSKSRDILMKLEEWEALNQQREAWLNGNSAQAEEDGGVDESDLLAEGAEEVDDEEEPVEEGELEEDPAADEEIEEDEEEEYEYEYEDEEEDELEQEEELGA